MLNRDVRQFGKKFMFGGKDETCWNSDQVAKPIHGSLDHPWLGWLLVDCSDNLAAESPFGHSPLLNSIHKGNLQPYKVEIHLQ